MLKLGIIILVVGLILIFALAKLSFNKRILNNIGIVFGILLVVYGMILIIQPNDDTYIQTTKTTTPYKDHK